jgi:glycosyltransferase involved in cell wall biosynthesis
VNETVLLIRSLDTGGAQRQLLQLAIGLHRTGVAVRVLAFYPGGALYGELQEAQVPVGHLAKAGRWEVIPFFVRLVAALRHDRPAVLYSFLPMANILSAVAKPFLPGLRVVWGVRASFMDLSRYDRLARLEFDLQERLARMADVIIANSYAGKAYHVEHGFPQSKIVVIPNGLDADRFRFDSQARSRVRADWGVGSDGILIGIAARLDPIKNYPLFLRAAARLAKSQPGVRFVCVGDGASAYRAELVALAGQIGLSGRLVWAGERHDMAAVYSAFDIATSSSSGEGFPNAIAEAMACGIPCVVTDVGDSAILIGDTGLVVPPGDPEALSNAWAKLLKLDAEERQELGRRARQRMLDEYGIENLVDRTEQVLSELVSSRV